jgi:hypothetical protein
MITVPVVTPDSPLESKVAFGEAELDLVYPGWFLNINVDDLEMYIDNFCIIGQLAGSFDLNRLSRFGWSEDDCILRGLYIADDDKEKIAKYDLLDEMWAKVINRKLDEMQGD